MKCLCIGPSSLGPYRELFRGQNDDFVPESSCPLAHKIFVCVKSLCSTWENWNLLLAWTSKEQELGIVLAQAASGSAVYKVPLLSEWAFLDGKSVTPLQARGTSLPLHSVSCVAWGKLLTWDKVCFVTALCSTLHKFLVVISTNISIQQSFSSCIQLMVGELFFLICIMAYECVIL